MKTPSCNGEGTQFDDVSYPCYNVEFSSSGYIMIRLLSYPWVLNFEVGVRILEELRCDFDMFRLRTCYQASAIMNFGFANLRLSICGL